MQFKKKKKIKIKKKSNSKKNFFFFDFFDLHRLLFTVMPKFKWFLLLPCGGGYFILPGPRAYPFIVFVLKSENGKLREISEERACFVILTHRFRFPVMV